MSSSTHRAHKPKPKSIRPAKPIVKGDVVLLSAKRIGVVRFVGEIAEYIDKGIYYGIQIRMTEGALGDSNGTIGNTTYFECALNEGLFVKLQEIIRRVEPKDLLEKVVKLTKSKKTMQELLNQSYTELTKLKKKYNVFDKSSPKKRRKRKKPKRPMFDDANSGSVTYTDDVSISDAPRSSIEFSISNDYSVTMTSNTKYNKYAQYRKNPGFDVSDDDTLPSTADVIIPTETPYTRNILSDNEVIPNQSSQHQLIPKSKINRSQSVEDEAKKHKKGVNGNKKNPFNISARTSIPSIQYAAPIQVATPLKAKNNQRERKDFEARQIRTKSQPQLMVAMHNELSPTAFEAKNAEIMQWDTSKVIEWVRSFGEMGQDDWMKLVENIQQEGINGNDLLLMDETNLLSERLGVDSPQIRYKIMSELAKQYQRTANNPMSFPDASLISTRTRSSVPTLQNSSSSPAKEDDVKVSSPSPTTRRGIKQRHSINNKYQYRLSLSSSPHRSPRYPRKVIFDKEFSDDDSKQSYTDKEFSELHSFFNKMDPDKTGKCDFNAFRLMLIELDPDLEPFKLTNDAIQKCFDEFDLTKTGYITIEEFIVVMGKTYLRGLQKSNRTQLTLLDINKYFIQLIKHFLKKVSKNISYTRHHSHSRTRKRSMSRSRSASKPAPPPRQQSVSQSRSVKRPPPPPVRDQSPSRSASVRYVGSNGHKPPKY